MKISKQLGTIRELEKDVQGIVRNALHQGCKLQSKGRSPHSKLELPNGVLVSIPGEPKILKRCLERHGLVC
jgi:hypothetical protein